MSASTDTQPSEETVLPSSQYPYDEWMNSRGVPVHRGFMVADLRTVELGWWEERGCDTAFIQLLGQEGVSETRVTEIPPGVTLPPFTLGVDEAVYVLQGNGLTHVWDGDTSARARTFEWHHRSLFMVPANTTRQFSNTSGTTPVRLMHYSYLPLAMTVVPDPEFFLNNPYRRKAKPLEENAFADARLREDGGGYRWVDSKLARGSRAYWYGNMFPDLLAWDKFESNEGRGAGSSVVRIQFAHSEMTAHMSVFASRLYKKAHRHGPGRAIVIPGGEGYSLMWEEGRERVIIPWQEGSMLVPPNRWFHQHFNLGGEPARYLAMHPPVQFHGKQEKVVDRVKDQIEYPDEDPWVRAYFEEQLAARGLTSLMPEEAYQNRDYVWK